VWLRDVVEEELEGVITRARVAIVLSATHLWVNDASYGETNPQCGAAGDVAAKTGGVFSFAPAQLTAKTTTVSQVLAFSNITGRRPGFGGVFVENDQ
jgi:cobalamin biosynthesis protein CobD/CbiB